jgi:ABC-type nitrate/sulfonate/bicarbonate transport system permease component
MADNKPIDNVMKKPRRKTRLLELRADIPAGLYFAAGASFIGAFFLIWLLLTSFGLVPPLFLPGPQAVWMELVRQIGEGILGQDVAASLYLPY